MPEEYDVAIRRLLARGADGAQPMACRNFQQRGVCAALQRFPRQAARHLDATRIVIMQWWEQGKHLHAAAVTRSAARGRRRAAARAATARDSGSR